ncbi:ATP-binding protein [Roseimaritima sediminicola]|uniref:ATP-binding protein n=1 Tax=Roseimaritima sediminicola TaxID=2662066 RepID=UPI0012983709|nr:helicase HerA-like domain-containing protein [Roseimaritima sediminicola]
MTPDVEAFEKLGAFYLGRQYDLPGGKLLDDLVMLDSKDLCTHAMCVGMTGSGKTGLCVSLLEEAAIDGVPVLCLDPKGDLTNLLLTFPNLSPEDFQPYLEAGEAMRRGMDPEQFAKWTAKTWKDGLASWGQSPERVARLQAAADRAIYTPGSRIGLPLTVLKSFDAPPAEVLADDEALRQRVSSAASALLTLLEIDANPLLSREHILLATIFETQWRAGQDVSVADLIGLIQSPPIERVGVLDLESFMSAADRGKLAMQLNNLHASPAFGGWLEGEPLSIQRLLYTDEGKPRVSVLSIAHLSDAQRMFFVTVLLNELVAWMRTQSGTGSLRALFYMDEVYGYFPPVAKPPSKEPMMTLLKQARAFGLGVMLATQNPVDLDYKGLSNIGTWFLGRLQTQRDKARVLDGLEGAAIQSGQAFDKAAIDQLLSALGNRRFLMNNVHDEAPVVFQTRWAMSFLAGPLSPQQIGRLMAKRKAAQQTEAAEAGEAVAFPPEPEPAASPSEPARPMAPAEIRQRFLTATVLPAGQAKRVYRPALLGAGSLHHVRASALLDSWSDRRRLLLCSPDVPSDLWQASTELSPEASLETEAEPEFLFYDLPAALCNADNYRDWAKRLKDYFYRHHALTLYKSPLLGQFAPAGNSEGGARIALTQAAHEARDTATEKLRVKYAKKLAAVEKRIRTAERRVTREKGQSTSAWVSTGVSAISTVFNAFMGNRISRRTSTTVRSASRASQQQGDVLRAEQALQDIKAEYASLEAELREDLRELSAAYDVAELELEPTTVAPRKGDLRIDEIALVWTPWQIDQHGMATPLYPVKPT